MTLEDFPATNGYQRENKIIECVQTGRAKYNFVKIVSEHNGHTGEFQVFEDALKVDGIRVNVSAETQQKIADLLRCVLPTAKIYDLMWHLAKYRTTPHTQPITASTKAMIEHSQKIDKELSEMGAQDGLKSSVGKTWIIDNSLLTKPRVACNYGWHFENGTSFKGIGGNVNASMLKNPNTGNPWYMIQSRGWHHSPTHVDYSQICILVSRKCWVDGKEMDILDVFKDPELAPLAVHDGVLKITRQPNVPILEPLVIQESIPEPLPSVPISVPIPSIPISLPSVWDDSHKLEQNLPVVAKPSSGGILTLIMNIIQMVLSIFKRKR